MTDLQAITHVEHLAEWRDPQDRCRLVFKPANAIDASHAILKSEHYRELIRVAADGRVARAAAEMAKKIVGELLEANPQAVDLYFKIIRDREEEKRNADV